MTERQKAEPHDPISQITGSSDAWSVSQTDAGCYLMSAYRAGTSRIAIGRHPHVGLGLFAINFALAVPSTKFTEPLQIDAGGMTIKVVAQLIGSKLMFVPLDQGAVDAVLGALKSSGTIWVTVRRTAMAHGGADLLAGIEAFGKACAEPPPAPPAAPPAS